MKVGDLVELTFLDHGENEEVDLSVVSTNCPVRSKVRGLVHKLDKCEGHRFAEIVIWEARDQNSKTAIILLSCVLSVRKLNAEDPP